MSLLWMYPGLLTAEFYNNKGYLDLTNVYKHVSGVYLATNRTEHGRDSQCSREIFTHFIFEFSINCLEITAVKFTGLGIIWKYIHVYM